MGYIYRYTDKLDNIIKYVGIVWSDTRTLKARIREHEHDPKFSGTFWKIEYLDVCIESRTDAEFLEAHYISLYKTYNWLNSSKANWGISSFVQDREMNWKEYNPDMSVDDYDNDNPLKVSTTYFHRLITTKSQKERQNIFRAMTGTLSKCNSVNKDYYKRVRDLLDIHLNDFLFGFNVGYARFNGNGEIIINFPFLQEVKYRDYDDTFYFVNTKSVVQRKDFVLHITTAIKKIIEEMLNNKERL